MPEAVRSETKGVVKKPSCVSRSLRAYRRSVSLVTSFTPFTHSTFGLVMERSGTGGVTTEGTK